MAGNKRLELPQVKLAVQEIINERPDLADKKAAAEKENFLNIFSSLCSCTQLCLYI